MGAQGLLAAFHALLSNNLEAIAHHLQPYQDDIRGVVVGSTYNWYWLVDGLIEQGYPVHLRQHPRHPAIQWP